MTHTTLELAMEPERRVSTTLKYSSCVFAILSLLTALLSESHTLVLASGSDKNGQQQPATLLPRPDPTGRPQLMVAVYCGGLAPIDGTNSRTTSTLYHNQYLDVDSRKWRSDRDVSATCTREKQAILNYCKKVYPNHDIRNIVESSRPYKIENWCRLGSSKRRCRTKLTTRPYRCLEGTFQSDALLVPERCVFDHVHNKSVCESSESWNKSATEACSTKNMKLQSFGMLQPCGLDVFSGVEFVCCPRTGDDSEETRTRSDSFISEGSNSFAQAANGILSAALSKEYDTDAENNIKTDDEVVKSHHDRGDNHGTEQGETESNGENQDEGDEYDEDEDGYDDDGSSWIGDKQSASSSLPTTTTTTTTTTTERPVERYLSHFDLAHEHEDYKKAELSIESSYRNKVTHVMREWSQLDGRYEEMKRNDPQAAEEFKRKMTHQFKKTIESLEQESAAQRHQLASMHAERAMAIINRRKKAAMDCLTEALDRIPIRTRQVEGCIVRLLKALEKDRSHTLRQYRNLLNLNTREALHERKIILEHLVTLNKAANQSIAMLDRSPTLVDKIKGKIIALWHKLRNIPLNEPIVKESEEKIMNQYEEEVAQRKIERERKRLVDQERPEHSFSKISADIEKSPPKIKDENIPVTKSTSLEAYRAASGSVTFPTSKEVQSGADKPVEIAEISAVSSQQVAPMSEVPSSVPSASRLVGGQPEVNDRDNTHYQTDSVGFSHLRLESPYHELSYSIKHEPLEGHMKFGSPTLLVSSFAAVVLLAFLGVKYYNRNTNRAYRRQGFAEVGRSCPEEKRMTHMQFNGYENPAYKFFEAEA